MSKPNPEKKKMATSREAYHRILWDERLNRSAFVIGYFNRTSEDKIREKPFLDWQSNGDIPWHRIRYIRCQEIVVWDRDRHLDLFSSGDLPTAAWVANSTEEINSVTVAQLGFESRPIYGYVSGIWQLINHSVAPTTIKELKIASWNVLCDRYESESIQTAKRIPAIAEHLRCCDADIISLQEATPPLLEFLLTQEWVQDYYISESPAGNTLEPYGILLLSRLPFSLVEHQYSAHKRVLVGTWQINDKNLSLAAIHLPSDRAHNSVVLRANQLNILLEYLRNQPGDCLMAGDFNTRGEELSAILTKNNFIDIWQLLHPEDPGYTFDPQRNTLAELMSLSGKQARFDRILLRDESKGWIPDSMELFGCDRISEPPENLYASDHFGVRAILKYAKEETAFLDEVKPVYQSAVVVIPPAEIWPAIQTIRRRFDRKSYRWMPHINLIYGFVPEEYFESDAVAIAPILAQINPFQITLEKFDTFTHRSSCTAWLRPIAQPPEALHQLQSILQQLFPQCNEQSTKSVVGFTPHLSVGQFASKEEALSQLPVWHPVSFPVEAIALISRRGDEPFEVRYIIYLGQQNVDRIDETASNLINIIDNFAPQLSQSEQSHRQTVLEVVKQACAECLGFLPSVHLLGSARLGVETSTSDLDVVCLIPADLSGKEFLESVQQKLEGICQRSSLAEDARVPALRMIIEGISTDLLYARTTAKAGDLRQIKEADRAYFDPVSWTAVLGCLEADLILDAVQKQVPLETFKKLLRAVRSWAKIRQIHGNGWGFLGNFSWALLAAWSCINYSQDDMQIEKLLAHFFQSLVQHDWNQPISLTEAGKNFRPRLPRDRIPVITSIEPCQNSAANVSRSTAEILQNEFDRGAKIAEKALAGEIGWESLFEAVEIERET